MHWTHRLVILASACAVLSSSAHAAELKQLFTDAYADDLLCWEIDGAPAEWLSYDTDKTPRLVFTSPNNRKWTRRAYLDQPFDDLPGTPADRTPPAATPAPPLPADSAPPAASPASPTPVADGHASQIILAHDVALKPSGKSVLHVRHTARSPGVHHWVLEDPSGMMIAEGTLTVKPPRDPSPVGPLGVSLDNQRLLSFRDGTIFIPIGPNIAWATGPNRLSDFARYFKALHDNGGNHARVWMASWCGGIEGATSDNYRLDQAWLFDRVLEMARANHIKLSVVLDNHDDIKFGKFFPYGASYDARLKTFLAGVPPAQYARRLEYVLARWGADDCVAAWELCNEIEQAQPIRERAVAWVKGAAALLAKDDQDGRLHTVSWAGDDWDQVATLPHIDVTQIHSYVLEWSDPVGLLRRGTRDGVGMLLNNAARANAIPKPFCFAELGYQGSNEKNPGNDIDTAGLLLRQQAWAGFMLGGYGTGMGWWWDVYIDKDALWPVYKGFAAAVDRIDWHDKDLLPVTPNQESSIRVIGWQSPRQMLLWPQLRNDTWYATLMDEKPRPHLKRATSVVMRGMTPDQAYTVHELDMVTGVEQASHGVTSNAKGNLELVAVPPLIDLVWWVEADK